MNRDTRTRLLYIRDALLDQATSFTCSEIEELAAVYRDDLHNPDYARQLIAAHAEGDEEGDAHHDS
jgi:hypothetical protein